MSLSVYEASIPGYRRMLSNLSHILDKAEAYANEKGLVAAPNVDVVEQTVEQIEAQRAFSANLSVIRTSDEMERSLLNISA